MTKSNTEGKIMSNLSVLYIAKDAEETIGQSIRSVLPLADQVVVMKGGGIDQAASPSELVASPASPYVAELLDKAGVS